MTLLARNKRPLHLPTRAQEVFDVTGAGDTVVAVLAVAVASRLPLAEAVKLANIAAGIVVAKLGTSSVSIQDLKYALETTTYSDNSRILNEEQLLAHIRSARLEGKRIVMTNGCFDIIHPGHVDYLERPVKKVIFWSLLLMMMHLYGGLKVMRDQSIP